MRAIAAAVVLSVVLGCAGVGVGVEDQPLAAAPQESVLAIMNKVNNYFQSTHPVPSCGWERATYYAGLFGQPDGATRLTSRWTGRWTGRWAGRQTQRHTHTHTGHTQDTHTDTQSHTATDTHMHTHARTHTDTHSHTLTHTDTHAHSHTRARAPLHP